MKAFISTLLLSQSVNAADWNYLKNGKDWPDGCQGMTNQTPIDLKSPGKKGFDYPLIEGV